MTPPEQAPNPRKPLSGRLRNREIPAARLPEAVLLDPRNDLAVALLALEALSADATLGAEQRRLADGGLTRLVRAIERLASLGPAKDHDDSR